MESLTTSSAPKRGAGQTRERVKHYAAKGLGASEIGRLLGISRQAVMDHLKRLRRDGELPEEAAV